MIETAACVFLIGLPTAAFALFQVGKRLYRHRPPGDSLWAKLLAEPQPIRVEVEGEARRDLGN